MSIHFSPSAALLEPEEREENAKHRLRVLIERRNYLSSLTDKRASLGEHHTHAMHNLRRVSDIKADEIRDAVVATIDTDFEALGHTFKARRSLIASKLSCSVATVNTRVTRGHRVLLTALRLAKEAAASTTGVPLCDASARTKRIKPNLRTPIKEKGIEFDSEARLYAIASELTPAEQELFVRILEERAVVGEIEAIDKSDKKTRIKMLPHAFNQVLHDVGRNDDQTRRALAKLAPDDAKALCADWMHEEVDKAIGGTTDERRAAREKYDARRYSKLIRKFIAHRTRTVA